MIQSVVLYIIIELQNFQQIYFSDGHSRSFFICPGYSKIHLSNIQQL